MNSLKQILLEQKMSPDQCLKALGFTIIRDTIINTVYQKKLDTKFFTSIQNNDLLFKLMLTNSNLRDYIKQSILVNKMFPNKITPTITLICSVNKQMIPQTIKFSYIIPTESLKKNLQQLGIPSNAVNQMPNIVKKHNFTFKDCKDLNRTIINQLDIPNNKSFWDSFKEIVKTAKTIKPADDRKAIKYKSGTPYGSGVKGYGGRL